MNASQHTRILLVTASVPLVAIMLGLYGLFTEPKSTQAVPEYCQQSSYGAFPCRKEWNL